MKIIEYDAWCPKCKYYEIPEAEDPCNECLNTPAQDESHKPIKYDDILK